MKKMSLVITLLAAVCCDALAGGDVVRYEDFGAVGDGRTDDLPAIVRAHEFANRNGLLVQADDQATYYIGGGRTTAIIQTDTDFGEARFVIDDTAVENRWAHVFEVCSALQPLQLNGMTSLKAGQRNLGTAVSAPCVVSVVNSNVKHYIRRGLNRNSGASQTDVFLVDEDGVVDAATPILWDFDQLTRITARPVDPVPLKISGGRFSTIANAAESKYNYYRRGIAIRRSNVLLEGLQHRITEEGEHGAPYDGFLSITDCANVTVRDVMLSGHKTYNTIGSADKPVGMGSYDLSVERALNVSLINCRQINDIKDRSLWGIFRSNGTKNLLLERCELSRFDAHRGAAGVTICNSTLGHAGILAIGHGKFIVENTTVYGRNFMHLRSDYGSTWQGDLIIRNCTWVTSWADNASLITGSNDGQHDFGYACSMPARITIYGLHIDDSRHPKNYQGMTVFSDFNPCFTDASYVEKFPYVKTREVILSDVSTASGRPLRISDNPVMFSDVLVTRDSLTGNVQ